MTDCARQLVTSGEDQQGHDSCPGNERGGRALCCLRGSHLFLSIGAGGGACALGEAGQGEQSLCPIAGRQNW